MSELNIVDNDLDDVAFLAALDDIVMEEETPVVEDDILTAIGDIEIEEEMASVYESQDEDSAVAIEVAEVSGEAIEEEEVAEPEVAPSLALAPVAKTPKVKAGAPKSEKIATRLGVDVQDYIMLTPDWAIKTDDERLEAFGKIIDGMAKYVGDKAVNLFTFLKTGGGLNIVTARGFEVFLKDGQLVGGKDGNIVQNLLAKPYSLGTANSQANQLLQLFTLLEIGKRTARGTVVVNEDSTILERVKDILGK